VDPGRRKFKHRDVACIANSDRIVTPAGVEWTVTSFDSTTEAVVLHVTRENGSRVTTDTLVCPHGTSLRCRTKMRLTS
jgi:hypothetical protein